jgi:cell division protein FtsN
MRYIVIDLHGKSHQQPAPESPSIREGPNPNERGLFVERTVTHNTEYVDIVLGYHHVLLFGLLFGVLMFSAGYFIGSYRTQSDGADRTISTATSPKPSSSAAELPAMQVPASGTERSPSEVGDVAKDMATLSTGVLAPAPNGDARPTATSSTLQDSVPAAPPLTTEAASPETTRTPPPNPPSAKATAASAAEAPKSEPQPRARVNQPKLRAAPTPANAGGHIYLQVSSFRARQEAEQLINDLAAEGMRATIDGQIVEGRHVVLVGPFADFQSAVGSAKALKQHNFEAFPIRR